MKRLLLLIMLLAGSIQAQVKYTEINSQALGEKRKIKIQLPRNYEENADQRYPVILVLDGNYLFEPVAGNVDYYSYWDDMPDALVVGIMQDDRRNDTYIDEYSGLPDQSGAAFFEFISQDVFSYLNKEYRLAAFNMIIGHDLTANFADFFLLRENPLFDAYVNLSPDFSNQMPQHLERILSSSNTPVFYYLATARDDVKQLRENIISFDNTIRQVENTNLHYYYDDFETGTHYSLVAKAIPQALEDIFAIYRPISKREYDEKILTSNLSPYEYLIQKYENIKLLFGLEQKINLNDFTAIAAALQQKTDWDGMEDLGKLARDEYPESLLGNYYLGLAYENSGKAKKALRTYESALMLKAIGGIDKELLLQRAEQIKKDFGY